ncbi:MAG: putative enoyl-CoA hydratase/isomerase family protein [Moraxellaceae bacterium]|jgi:enoyl-CoA hydratase/carnithine racemase|nr:putative enoyl-CoA hydratase/isomerase family protein [Moraxellaceae bacterium]
MTFSPVVLLEERPAGNGNVIGIATLNSERSLNSLSLEMIDLLLPAMRRWAQDGRVIAVFLQGAGEKAFCAGGDVRRICLAVRENGIEDSYAQSFFTEEYKLDYLIHTYPKPVIVWGQGIVMGGGIGLMSGASHRIVTETSRLAMPEITIGLYPDVGGSYFLSRVKGRLGLFVGMTGVHLNAADALHIGLADHAVAGARREAVIAALCAVHWSVDASQHRQQVSATLAAEQAPELAASELQQREAALNRRAGSDDLAALYASLTAPVPEDPWLNRTAQSLAKGSPTSAALIHRQWLRGASMTLEAVFQEELVISCQCARHPDFIEGVRALLVDKDNAPEWQPPRLDQVTEEWIAGHYVAPWQGEHPLHTL